MSKKYGITALRTKAVLEEAKEAKDEHGAKLREQLEAIKKQKVEELEAQAKKKKGMEVHPELVIPRLPLDSLQQIYLQKLSQKAYQNKGYILEGYPKTYAEACNVFLGMALPDC